MIACISWAAVPVWEQPVHILFLWPVWKPNHNQMLSWPVRSEHKEKLVSDGIRVKSGVHFTISGMTARTPRGSWLQLPVSCLAVGRLCQWVLHSPRPKNVAYGSPCLLLRWQSAVALFRSHFFSTFRSDQVPSDGHSCPWI